MRLAAIARLFARKPHGTARRVLRISRVVAELERAEAFYRDGLGFTRIAEAPLDPALATALQQPGGATTRTLRLGADEIVLVQWATPGASYPAHSRSNDCWFQHLAIVVDDMQAAYARLMRQAPRAISTDGPQPLPGPRAERLAAMTTVPGQPSPLGRGLGEGTAAAPTRGVTAYKFRDPDGHPLELIRFPPDQGRAVWHRHRPGPCLGIDHTALSVSSTPHSLRFYRGLGFTAAGRTFNHGPAQAALDGLPGAQLRVTSLRPGDAEGPGIELLGYLPPGRPAPAHAADAMVTDWITLDTGRRGPPEVLRDPDGHILVLA